MPIVIDGRMYSIREKSKGKMHHGDLYRPGKEMLEELASLNPEIKTLTMTLSIK